MIAALIVQAVALKDWGREYANAADNPVFKGRESKIYIPP